MGGLHLIIGEDDFLVESAAKRIVGDGVGLEVVDSADSTNAESQLGDLRAADASFSTPPFLDPRKVTWWKNVHFLPGSSRRQASEEVKTALEKFARKLAGAEMPDNQDFIITAPHLLKTSVFAKTLASAAEVVSFAAGKPWEAAKAASARTVDYAAALGLVFAPGAAELFVSRVGTDSRSLMSELGKMRDYLGEGNGTITAADIAEITSQGVGVEPEVWAVTDALGERNVAKALEAARRFENENGFAVFISGVVERFFRQLVELKAASERGSLDEAVKGMSPFAARKNTAFLRNWTLNELRVARWRFLSLREKAVTASASADVLLMCELVRVCRRAVRR
jgi:DNA polymerase III delta subunit